MFFYKFFDGLIAFKYLGGVISKIFGLLLIEMAPHHLHAAQHIFELWMNFVFMSHSVSMSLHDCFLSAKMCVIISTFDIKLSCVDSEGHHILHP